MTAPLFIGIEADGDGSHPQAWRFSAHPPAALLTPWRIRDLAQRAEQAGFDFLSFSDGRPTEGAPNVAGRLDPIEAATFAAAVTEGIGLVPAANAIHAEPYHLANQLASLDWASHGRAGWFLRAADSRQLAAAYGADWDGAQDARLSARLASEGREVLAAVRLLWDSWQDEVFIADRAADRFLDLDRWHYADFVGEHFSIKGPSLVPRPPQGQPIVFSALGAPVDAALSDAAQTEPTIADSGKVDVLAVLGADAQSVRAAAVEARARGAARVVTSVQTLLTDGDAGASGASRQELLRTEWPASPALRYVGEAAGLVRLLQELRQFVDGVRLDPAVIDLDLPLLAERVLPAFPDRTSAAEPGSEGDYLGTTTLRSRWGLPKPANRFAAETAASGAAASAAEGTIR